MGCRRVAAHCHWSWIDFFRAAEFFLGALAAADADHDEVLIGDALEAVGGAFGEHCAVEGSEFPGASVGTLEGRSALENEEAWSSSGWQCSAFSPPVA